MKKYSLITLSGLLLFSTAINAADNTTDDTADRTVGFVIEGGLHFGGDTLANVTFTNGDTDEVKAGELLSLAAGVRFNVSESLESVITLGIKTDKVNASNGDITFNRIPLNALVLYKADDWRFGGGLTYHMSPELKVDVPYYNYTVEFKDALGLLADVRYFFSENAYVGGRYTIIEYEVKSTGATFSGNSIGVVLGAVL